MVSQLNLARSAGGFADFWKAHPGTGDHFEGTSLDQEKIGVVETLDPWWCLVNEWSFVLRV
jgi:hypothetical protein